MIFMGSKLLSKGGSVQAVNNTNEDNDGVSQKDILRSLSMQEKLLLVELHKTRRNIVDELRRAELDCNINDIGLVENTIRDYEVKISTEIARGKDAGTPGTSRTLPNLTSRQGTGFRSTATKLSSSLNPKITSFKTGVDMLPVLSATTKESGLKVRSAVKMPIFKLPNVDISRFAQIDQIKSGMDDESSLRDYSAVKRLDIQSRFMSTLKSITPRDREGICSYLSLTHDDYDYLFAQLLKNIDGFTVEEGTSSFSIICSQFSNTARLSKKSLKRMNSGSSSGSGTGGLNDRRGSLSQSLHSTSLHGSESLMSKSMTLSQNKGPSKFQKTSKTSRAATLRDELRESLKTVEAHSSKLKQGLIEINKYMPLADPKLVNMRFVLAAEALSKVIWKLVLKEFRKGLESWKVTLQVIRNENRTKSFARCLYARNLIALLFEIAIRKMGGRFVTWVRFTRKEKRRLRKQMELKAIITIQRVYRGRLGRRRVNLLLQKNKYQAMYDATIKLQAIFRGCLSKWKYQRYRREKKEDRSIRLLQRVIRGYLARKRVHRLLLQKNKFMAATQIQAVVRGRIARRRIARLKLLHIQNRAAVKIQAMIRGFMVRRNLQKILLQRAQWDAAIQIQRIIRGFLSRILIKRKKTEILEFLHQRSWAALRIQAVYRGYRSRIYTKILAMERDKTRQRLNRAATKIQTLIRKFVSCRRVQRLMKERLNHWMAQARSWKEIWSEDAKAYFYMQSETGEAVWEPRIDGYTKADGRLVLANGKIIDDPRFKIRSELENEEDEEAKNRDGRMCSECSENISVVFCQECGDKFCMKCYKSLHAIGSRRSHTTKRLGPLECSECESRLAERFCVSCDEAYCDLCWRKLHARGKRRFHPFQEVSPQGYISPKIFTIEGEEVNDYQVGYSQAKLEAEEGSASYNDGSSYDNGYNEGSTYYDPNVWAMYYDDNGDAYWYNSETGESQYEQPG